MSDHAQKRPQAGAQPARLEDLDQLERLLRGITGHDRDGCFRSLDVLWTAHGKTLRSSLSAHIKAALEAHAKGDEARTLELLETVAGHAPHSPAFCLGNPREQNAGGELAPVLESLLRNPGWADSPSCNELRAVLGLGCFTAGRLDPAVALLSRVRWQDVKKPSHFLSFYFLLYWGSLADIADAMAEGLFHNQHWHTVPRGSLPLELGNACAHSGMPQEARKILAPLLRKLVRQPGVLFSALHALFLAGATADAAKFLQTRKTLASIRQKLDLPQTVRLGQYLDLADMPAEAADCFATVAARSDELTPPEIPDVVYGLVNTHNLSEACRFLDEIMGRAGGQALKDNQNLACNLAEALLATGRVHEARTLLEAIPTERPAGDPLSPRLYFLHERLGDPEKMRALLPSIPETAEPISLGALHYLLPLLHFEGRLEQGLERGVALFGARTNDCLYTKRIIHYHFLLGDFAAVKRLTMDRTFTGRGQVGFQRLYWQRIVLLAEKRYAEAVQAFELYLEHLETTAVEFYKVHYWWAVQIFEFALLLRFLERGQEALALAQRCVARLGVAHNPCAPLAALLARECAGSVPTQDEAAQFEHVADMLCWPRDSCQLFLYLQAAALRERLGQPDEARRVLRHKAAQALYVAPALRQRLAEHCGQPLAAQRQTLQACVFPLFRQTYWNDLLDDFLNSPNRK